MAEEVICFQQRYWPDSLYEVSLECTQDECLQLAWHHDMPGLLILDIDQSEAVKRWNAEHERQIEEGHVILKVNDLSEPRAMCAEFMRGRQLELLVNEDLTVQQWAFFSECQWRLCASEVGSPWLETLGTACAWPERTAPSTALANETQKDAARGGG